LTGALNLEIQEVKVSQATNQFPSRSTKKMNSPRKTLISVTSARRRSYNLTS